MTSRRTAPRPKPPAYGAKITFSGNYLYRARPPSPQYGRVGTLPSSPKFCTPASSEGINWINSALVPRLWVSARAYLGPLSEFSASFSGAPADHSPDVLAVAPCNVPALTDTPTLPEHGPNLVGGTITLDNASFISRRS